MPYETGFIKLTEIVTVDIQYTADDPQDIWVQTQAICGMERRTIKAFRIPPGKTSHELVDVEVTLVRTTGPVFGVQETPEKIMQLMIPAKYLNPEEWREIHGLSGVGR
jgi:hypothetical protein